MAEVGYEVCVLARTDQSPGFFGVFFTGSSEAESMGGGGAGEVNTSTEPRNKAETTCPPSGDR